MQDTNLCEPGVSPAPAPSTPSINGIAVKPMQILTAKEKFSEQHAMSVSQNNNNYKHTKEIKQTKDNSVIEEVCRENKKEKGSTTQNLDQRNLNSEDVPVSFQVAGDTERESCRGDTQYICPICNTVLFSSHDFTIHIRSHNNSSSEDLESSGRGYICRVCGKVLSSASSLDRHVLVHSGERAFKCKVCGFSFTTSGNMRRHMRTHSSNENGDSFSYDSDASSDSLGSSRPQSPPLLLNLKKRRVSRSASEFNNNIIELSPPSCTDVTTKRKIDLDDLNSAKKKKSDNKKSTIEKFDCSLCDKTSFLTLNLLETHIEECHPDYKAKCNPCNLVFKNHRVLNLHRYMVHHAEIKEQIFANPKQETIGFKDLTFVDFSSEKFPHIARAMCEQSLHHASSLHHRFQCEKCGRAFPCRSALSIHRQGCGNENYASSGESYYQDNELSSSDNETPTDLSSTGKRASWSESKVSESSDDLEDEQKRYNFFACLDLQNKSTTESPSQQYQTVNQKRTRDAYFSFNSGENKDLADIQSIISVASAGGLLHDLSKSPQPTVLEVTPPDSGSRIGLYDTTVNDEEQQDCFAAEFRKMKLRGEFPCRLCTAIFPNLRALKGHNRVHLSSNGGQNSAPYRCNMCPHFSSDKSALIRHMRTHNGDRPYECALCHYAFTTKANCERHLRNRHAKMTREDVKKSIIYHPSEDPTNDIDHKPSRDDVKRSLFVEKEVSKRIEHSENLKTENLPNVVKNIEKDPNVFDSIRLQQSSAFTQVKKIAYMEELGNIDSNQRKCFDVGTMTYDEIDSENTMSNLNSVTIHKPAEVQPDIPLDLSMDALDLSKKRNSHNEINEDERSSDSDEELRPQDLSKKSKSDKIVYPLSVESIEKSKISKFSQDNKGCLGLQSPSSHRSLDKDSPVPLELSCMPKFDLSKFYPPTTHPFYLNNTTAFPPFPSASSLPSGPYPPYFIPPPPPVLFPVNSSQNLADMKERLQKELIRGLQLTSGGSLVFDQITMANAADRIQAFHQQAMAEISWRMENKKEDRTVYTPPSKREITQPAVLTIEKESKIQENTHDNAHQQQKLTVQKQETNEQKLELPKHKQETSTSVKMVIKNGVLIPKQKQRRYRTERPFSCEHCSARFTLRSNMERHIKQQHPHFWTQRQRNTANTPTKRIPVLNSKLSQNLMNQGQFYPHGLSVYNPKSEDDISRSSISNEPTNYEKLCLGSEGKPCISEEVKNAIAQQLKSKLPSTVLTNEEENYDDLIDEEEDEELVIDEEVKEDEVRTHIDSQKLQPADLGTSKKLPMKEENLDLASVSRLLDNASTQTFRQYFRPEDDHIGGEGSEEDEEGLVAAGSTSEGCNSGSDENRSESEVNSGTNPTVAKKKSAYSLAPNRVSCPYCFRKFPWSSSLRRHVLTHTGQKPYKCSFCPLLFTTKSNCDRHLLRKHGGGGPTTSNETLTMVSTDSASNQNNTPNYTMRNVPERPYKCKSCPSSTFSTLSNLKKHLSTKHQIIVPCKNDGTQSGYESQGSISEEIDVGENENRETDNEIEKKSVIDPREIHPGQVSENSSLFKTHSLPVEQNFMATQPSDLPFKCHLCEGSFSERQEALDHIKENHCAEFQLLVSKGALEATMTAEDSHNVDEGGEENLEQLRGKFPDYANRKVMCAFCLRRFWSAEDLRRHMRTHTGERPFSCDICRRRFTLKHSMLRHRKKHSFSAVEEASPASDDENGVPSATTTLNNNNTIVTQKPWVKVRLEEESDLISNLLGIQDKTIVDKMLISKSADDAAKLLGVQK